MSRYRRLRLPGATIFFTVALERRGSTVLCDEIDLLRLAVAQTRQERPFVIDAWVVLPDHMHCLWTLPPGDADYATRWGAIKARFTRSLRDRSNGRGAGWNPDTRPRSASKRAKGDAGLWQRRFWEHHIRDQQDYADHLNYCWWNPVRHGLADHPEGWPYSSIHRDRRSGSVGEFAGHPVLCPSHSAGSAAEAEAKVG